MCTIFFCHYLSLLAYLFLSFHCHIRISPSWPFSKAGVQLNTVSGASGGLLHFMFFRLQRIVCLFPEEPDVFRAPHHNRVRIMCHPEVRLPGTKKHFLWTIRLLAKRRLMEILVCCLSLWLLNMNVNAASGV